MHVKSLVFFLRHFQRFASFFLFRFCRTIMHCIIAYTVSYSILYNIHTSFTHFKPILMIIIFDSKITLGWSFCRLSCLLIHFSKSKHTNTHCKLQKAKAKTSFLLVYIRFTITMYVLYILYVWFKSESCNFQLNIVVMTITHTVYNINMKIKSKTIFDIVQLKCLSFFFLFRVVLLMFVVICR